YCPCQSEVFLGLIVYMQHIIDRCARRRLPFTVDAFSIHRLVITAVTIASKWFSDVFFTNSRYAKVTLLTALPLQTVHAHGCMDRTYAPHFPTYYDGGLSVAELNNLELQFLSLVDFDLGIQPEVLQAIGSDLFAGKLPRLANAQIPHLHVAPVPLSARRSEFYPAPRGYPQAQQRQQRPLRRMSYPGPAGACYPASYATVYDKYHAISAQLAAKQSHPSHAASRHAAPLVSSGSTLTSSSPGDTTAIAALNQGVV
ncbi:cyclin-like protein interacting with PHO85, partial [Coemansia sp. RSA 2673]